MSVEEILNQIDLQSEYVIVYYDSEKQQRFKLEKCLFSKTVAIRFMYVENDILIFELDEWHLFSDSITKNRDISFLHPRKF